MRRLETFICEMCNQSYLSLHAAIECENAHSDWEFFKTCFNDYFEGSPRYSFIPKYSEAFEDFVETRIAIRTNKDRVG